LVQCPTLAQLLQMDKDKDGRISLADWKSTLASEPLLLEAFGPCLPAKGDAEALLERCREADNH
jgi:hypothetical protein